MNVVLLGSSDKDWRECPVCRTTNYPRDNSGKFAFDWYVLMLQIDDAVYLSTGSWSCDRRLQSEHNINNTSTDSAQTITIYKEDFELIRNMRIYKDVGSLTYHNKS